MNIIWKQPTGRLSVTSVPAGELPSDHAALLQGRGDVPDDWVTVAFNNSVFPSEAQESWRWDGSAIVVDPAASHALSVPDVVFSWQLRRALSQQGLRAAVESAILASSQDTQDMWQFATEYHRNHAMVAEIAAAIGKTDSEIDAVFILARSIT